MSVKQLKLSRFAGEEISLIRLAYKFADKAHQGQQRKSGQPYISHPVAVANILADWGMDTESVAAGLLHDTLEDTQVTLTQLEEAFGPRISGLVDGVTKLGQVDYQPSADPSSIQEASRENLRKLLLAMTKDLRVVMVKLADRQHNLETLKYLDPPDRERVAQESLAIFAPLADRLGMGVVKGTIEDLSFQYAYPDEYKKVAKISTEQLKKVGNYLSRLKRFIQEELASSGIQVVNVEGRRKGLYSLHKKLKKVDGDIEKVYDLVAVRIIVPETADCYKAMGLLHQQFKPLIYRIKDYIAVPKPNGYRSLHTTVFALDGRITEIQIRTPEMHEEAERGLAAHFYYDQQKATKAYSKKHATAVPGRMQWVNTLLEISDTSLPEFTHALEVDLFKDRIFVFTPKGDLFDLPEGATPLDFAFSVHSDIGLRTQGAKVNGRMVPLDSVLENRDVVQIITRKHPAPSRDWLKIIKTPKAGNRIRAWFRLADRERNINTGKQIVESELKHLGLRRVEDIRLEVLSAFHATTHDDLLALIGEGSIKLPQLLAKLKPVEPTFKSTPKPKGLSHTEKIVFEGGADMPYSLATCCQPKLPQPIVGFITRSGGITVHRQDCSNVGNETDRLVGCNWHKT